MKTSLLALASVAVLAAAPALAADDTKIGVLLGFTGPLESLAGPIAGGAELAIAEINDSGKFMGGGKLTPVRGDDTCIDAGAGTAAAERLVTSDGVKGIMGAMCSGVTGAVLKNVAIPNGIVMISPSATSPALSTVEDNGLFFRTAPSDARQGEIIAGILADKGVKSAALTFTNNDYGKGLSDSIAASAAKKGIKITINAPHEDGKGDYSAEVAALAAAGGDILIVAGYLDQGGKGIIQGALDSGAFDTFYLPDGMVGDALPKAIGKALDGSYGAKPGSDSQGSQKFAELAKEKGVATGVYVPEAYDAAALIALAMEAAKSTDSAKYKDKVMEVANAPGEKILPGELGKALELVAAGKDIDYQGATDVELIGNGENAGRYQEIEIKDGAIATVGYR